MAPLRIRKLIGFVSTRYFDRAWDGMGLSDEDRRQLELAIMADPTRAPLIQGTGGLRKIRVARRQGKSGGARVCYAQFAAYDIVLLYTVYAKSAQENLSAEAKAVAKRALAAFERELAKESAR